MSPTVLQACYDELIKISQEQSLMDRAMAIAPGAGALIGGAVGAADPHRFDPSVVSDTLKGKGARTVKGRIVSGVLGAGLGATTGWLPSALRDAYRAIRPQQKNPSAIPVVTSGGQ